MLLLLKFGHQAPKHCSHDGAFWGLLGTITYGQGAAVLCKTFVDLEIDFFVLPAFHQPKVEGVTA